MFCTNCGKKVPDGSKFCPSYGVPVAEDKEKEPIREEITKAEHPAESKVVDIQTEAKQEIPQKESILAKGIMFILGIAIIAGIAYFVNLKTGYNIITGEEHVFHTNLDALVYSSAVSIIKEELNPVNPEFSPFSPEAITKIAEEKGEKGRTISTYTADVSFTDENSVGPRVLTTCSVEVAVSIPRRETEKNRTEVLYSEIKEVYADTSAGTGNGSTLLNSSAISDISGNWEDSWSERCVMTITAEGNDHYSVNVIWAGNAYTYDEWIFSGYYDSNTGILSYEDGMWVSHGEGDIDGETYIVLDSMRGELLYDHDTIFWTDYTSFEYNMDFGSSEMRFEKR